MASLCQVARARSRPFLGRRVSATLARGNYTAASMTRRVPFTGGEKESLRVSLDRHRDAVLWKLEGLGES